MKNDFTDLHNEFRDNLKQINQQQLDENFVQLEQQLDEIAGLYNLKKSAGRGLKSGLRTAGGLAKKVLPKERIDIGKMLLNPGQYATDYDPEKMLKKGVSKLGFVAQAKMATLGAGALNLLFGGKKLAYQKYMKQTIEERTKALKAQRAALKYLRGLNKTVMLKELDNALFDYLYDRKYLNIIAGDERKKLLPKDSSPLPSGTGKNVDVKKQEETKRRLQDERKERNTYSSKPMFPTTEDFISELGKNIINEQEEESKEEKIERERKEGVEKEKNERNEDFRKVRISGMIKNSGGYTRIAIEKIIRADANLKLSSDIAKQITFHAMCYCVARVFEKRLAKYPNIFLGPANPVLVVTTTDRQRYLKEKDPSVFYPLWFKFMHPNAQPDRVYDEKKKEYYNPTKPKPENDEDREIKFHKKHMDELDDKERKKPRTLSPEEKYETKVTKIKNKYKLPDIPEMRRLAEKMKNFRFIASFVNIDNMQNLIEKELSDFEAEAAKLDYSDDTRKFRSPEMKIKGKLKEISTQIQVIKNKMNALKSSFANLDNDSKEEKRKNFEDKHKYLQKKYNELVGDAKKVKDILSKYYDGEKPDLDALDNLGDYTVDDTKKDEKKSEKGAEEEVSMSAFRDLLDTVRASAYEDRLDMNAVQDAEIMATKVSNKIPGIKLANLRQMLDQAKETKPEKEEPKTQTDSYEFQMKDFDYLAEKFIQKESSPLLESMPMIRFRRNPREGTSKIVMVCGKDEFKKSLNKTINVAGKKVKDVMCLPKQLKSAKDRLKDRKASIKRWRKIRVNSVTVERMNRKKQETKKASRTLRK